MDLKRAAEVFEQMGGAAHTAISSSFATCNGATCVEARAFIAEMRAEEAKPPEPCPYVRPVTYGEYLNGNPCARCGESEVDHRPPPAPVQHASQRDPDPLAGVRADERETGRVLELRECIAALVAGADLSGAQSALELLRARLADRPTRAKHDR